MTDIIFAVLFGLLCALYVQVATVYLHVRLLVFLKDTCKINWYRFQPLLFVSTTVSAVSYTVEHTYVTSYDLGVNGDTVNCMWVIVISRETVYLMFILLMNMCYIVNRDGYRLTCYINFS